MKIKTLVVVLAGLCCLGLAASHAQAQTTAKPRGQWIWVKQTEIEFKPTATQTATIDAAVAKGAKSIVLSLSDEQMAWIKQNYGFTASKTRMALPKTTPKGFTVAVSSDYRIEFRDFFAMQCENRGGTPRCTSRRYQVQVEVWPDKQRPDQAALDGLKVAPVFTKAQRVATENAKRDGTEQIEITATPHQQKAFAAMSPATPEAKMRLQLMQLTADAKTQQDAKLHAMGCTMEWSAWCDKYGCHELCVPQCD